MGTPERRIKTEIERSPLYQNEKNEQISKVIYNCFIVLRATQKTVKRNISDSTIELLEELEFTPILQNNSKVLHKTLFSLYSRIRKVKIKEVRMKNHSIQH